MALSFRDGIHSSRATATLTALDANKLAQLLHMRLHIGAHLIRALPTLTADAPEKLAHALLSACLHWVAASATRLPHRGGIKYKPTLPGRLFYTDIARPFPPTTPHRYRYSLVLVDDHSRFKFGMLGLVARSDAPAKLTRCVARLNSHASSNAHITPLSRLHSDAAGEFRAAAFLDRWPTTSTRSSRLRRSIS